MFDYTFQWRSTLRALPDMLAGAWVTFETAALSMICLLYTSPSPRD